MGKLIPLARFRATPLIGDPLESTAATGALDWELAPIAALLFLASVARVARAVWHHEAFAAEPTFALVFAIGLPWLAWRWRLRRVP